MKAFKNCMSSKASGIEKFFKNYHSAERLTAFILIFVIMCHVSACLFYLLAKIEGIYPNSWVLRYSLQDSSNFQVYRNIYIYILFTIIDLDIYSQYVLDNYYNYHCWIWRHQCRNYN